MRQFRVVIQDWQNNSIATGISVSIPENMSLAIDDDKAFLGRRVNPDAVAEALKQIVGELARYALSEALLVPPRK